MNITSAVTKDYEYEPPPNPAKTNPTCRGVASGKAGSSKLLRIL
jgi:hypothetical protein